MMNLVSQQGLVQLRLAVSCSYSVSVTAVPAHTKMGERLVVRPTAPCRFACAYREEPGLLHRVEAWQLAVG